MSGQQLPGGDPAVRPEDGLELGDRLQGDPRARPVVGADDGAVGCGDRGDLAFPEAVLDRLLGEVLTAYAELVHVGAGHVLDQSQVFRGLPHRDVDVGQLALGAWVHPGVGATLGDLRRTGHCLAELRILGPWPAVAVATGETRHHLHTRGDEDVTLTRLDRMHGHPGGLQGRGAVAGDGQPRQLVLTQQDRHDPAHVETLLAAGQAAAQHEVVDISRVQLGNLVQCGLDDGGGEVVGPQILQ